MTQRSRTDRSSCIKFAGKQQRTFLLADAKLNAPLKLSEIRKLNSVLDGAVDDFQKEFPEQIYSHGDRLNMYRVDPTAKAPAATQKDPGATSKEPDDRAANRDRARASKRRRSRKKKNDGDRAKDAVDKIKGLLD